MEFQENSLMLIYSIFSIKWTETCENGIFFLAPMESVLDKLYTKLFLFLETKYENCIDTYTYCK